MPTAAVDSASPLVCRAHCTRRLRDLGNRAKRLHGPGTDPAGVDTGRGRAPRLCGGQGRREPVQGHVGRGRTGRAEAKGPSAGPLEAGGVENDRRAMCSQGVSACRRTFAAWRATTARWTSAPMRPVRASRTRPASATRVRSSARCTARLITPAPRRPPLDGAIHRRVLRDQRARPGARFSLRRAPRGARRRGCRMPASSTGSTRRRRETGLPGQLDRG